MGRRSRRSVETPLSGPAALSSAPPGFPVVAIGASAGGLDACRKLVAGLPPGIGMAFILVQHLDPTHESMMVDLLAGHTTMPVQQVVDGALLEPDHLYVIPPGRYLALVDGALHLSQPAARHGTRLPFDFLLNSMAAACAGRSVCIVLSGTGSDGSLGLQAIKQQGGLAIVQDPGEAGYDGMPRSAIATGMVDLVLPVDKIPEALVARGRGTDGVASAAAAAPGFRLGEVVDLLRQKTSHDFRLYKPGTLQRRIERRMAMAAIEPSDMDRYLAILRDDRQERDLLAKDLLIHVTSFFRDPRVFDRLAQTVIPDLVRERAPDLPLRIWIAGCSTGEETYSITMLFREAIAAAGVAVKLQVFASDVDADAIAVAREGVYPHTIEAEVSAPRLARFFTKEKQGYRVAPDVRAAVVFSVQDVLSDPPFSRIDLVSCRNLLIYLGPEAQAKVIALFHFALRPGGILLLGSAETPGNLEGRFAVLAKSERIYRHVGRSRPGEIGLLMGGGDGIRPLARPGQTAAASRETMLSDLCRRIVLDSYAPAAVLVTRRYQCLYLLGATDRYLRVASGHPSHDLLAMAPPGLRTKLRSAIQQVGLDHPQVTMAGGRVGAGTAAIRFRIDVRLVQGDGEELVLVAFVDEPTPDLRRVRGLSLAERTRVGELELELEATRTELQGAIHNLELSSEEQRAINEEALSVSEEYQSTNEELLTSKEELQSLNEELTALNSQLQETLERQRTTSDDLRNVLYSTDVATLFLDIGLNIRFFTPATKALFNVLPADIGRPLADLHSLASDVGLPADVRTVLQNLSALDREIETEAGTCFNRRILPYRTHDNDVQGVVITFTDITDRKNAAKALDAAKRQADAANAAKSRFLAAASHDLRQPLQALTLLHGLLAKTTQGDAGKRLLARLDETLGAMTGMLDTLLDINQIESGTIRVEVADFPIDDLLDRMRDEFAYLAEAHGLVLHVVRCSLRVCSDARLMEQMLRNLLSNALKYTKRGKILLGCRRHGNRLAIEVWDSGLGIPEDQLHAIFEEYYQVDNPARGHSRGLGLGLSIVQRLGHLLEHPVAVRSWPGRGSVFSIEVGLTTDPPAGAGQPGRVPDGAATSTTGTGTILIIEDDPALCELLALLLEGEGHRVVTAVDGPSALALAAQAAVRPDLLLADYNLPGGMDGLALSGRLREAFGHPTPVVILTGDISTTTLRSIAQQNFVHINKPVKVAELTALVGRLMPPAAAGRLSSDTPGTPAIFVIDDDDQVRRTIRSVFEEDGQVVEDYASCEAFLEAVAPEREGCVLVDARLPGMGGLELLRQLGDAGRRLPAIMMTGDSDVRIAVEAMKAGAADFIEKPVAAAELLASVARAQERSRDRSRPPAWRAAAIGRVAGLTERQHQIMGLVLAGHPSKNIAADLGISQRTVENHRAAIMRTTGAKSLPALARLALAASWNGTDAPADRDGPSAVTEASPTRSRRRPQG
ncbi:protein-glutamate methylesterase [Allostella vacuolata]|nr:protein-glutamate methylesterase [Stella vacuolata]